MYIPKFNAESRTEILHQFIRTHPLGGWTTMCDGALEVNHIPFVLRENKTGCEESEGLGVLAGHVAKSNPVYKTFSRSVESVVVFQGPESYISPSWYPSKSEHGKVVPTWNYMVVHAHGIPKVIENPKWLLEHLNEMTNIFERDQPQPWQVSDAPPEFIEKLVGAIVGIEIPIARLQGKWKLGQHRSEADIIGTISGLRSKGDQDAPGLNEELADHLAMSLEKHQAEN